MEYKSEAHLQSLCTKWHREQWPDEYDRLILIYNNPPNPRMGAMLKSMGLQKGTSDQVYFYQIEMQRGLCWIEYKIKGRKQKEGQEKFQDLVEGWGFKYKVIWTEDEFKALMRELH